ncbi:hypothetical protein DYB30_007944 [Aphanomyces astaci]|uniref:ABC transporter domain-containing protein n=1 Tax=Aphanomyces astaci TaxID=112090 RepID=A0A397E0Z8_APHAT|nr:hypothetical protein DYB30_007944 [Aphanomyces astaci]
MSLCVFLAAIDMVLRCGVWRRTMRRFHSASADALLWVCMLVVWFCRIVWPVSNTGTSTGRQLVPLLSVALASMRLVLKPRARQLTKACSRQRQCTNTAIRLRPTFSAPTGDTGTSSEQKPLVYSTWNVIRSTLSHWATQRTDLAWCIVVMFINASINPLQAYCLQHLLDQAFLAATSSANPQVALHHGMTGLIVLCVPFGLSTVGIGVFQSRMLARATARLHSQLLHVVLAQPATYFVHDAKEGDVTNVFASDVARVNALWQGVFWNLLHPAIVAAGGFGYLLVCDFNTGWLAFWVAIVLVSSGPQGRAAAHSTTFGAANAALTASFQDTLSSHATVVVYDMQPSIQAKFDVNVQALSSIQFAKDLWATLVQIYIEGAMYTFVAVVTAGLATRVVVGHTLTAGEFVSYVALLGRISSPITVLGGFMRVAIGNSSSLQRVDALLALSSDGHVITTDDMSFKSMTTATSTDSISAAHPLQTALTASHLFVQVNRTVVVADVSFACPRGTLTCIVGPSGSGKTSVLRCLMQTGPSHASGHIWWDKWPLTLAHQAHVGVVFQHPRFLHGTIRENLRYGHPRASDADCHDAAAMAHCLPFVNELPKGLDTDMASVQWSGGQLQRLSLARALVRRPRYVMKAVLLLDEATSALDQESELAVVATLTWLAKTQGTVVVAVTHRLATTKVADQIIVLQAGRMVEVGRHADLMERRGIFYDLAHENDASSRSKNGHEKGDVALLDEEGDAADVELGDEAYMVL